MIRLFVKAKMFTPNSSIKCEKEMQFHRIPEIYFNDPSNLCDSNVPLTHNSQSESYTKSFSYIENVSNKSDHCEYYIKNSVNTCGHSNNFEKFKFSKVNCGSFDKVNANSTLDHHDMINIGSLDESSHHYPVDDSINYEFDIPISLTSKEKVSGLANVIHVTNNDETNNGNFMEFFISE